MYSQVRATWGIFTYVELTRCAFSAHEKLDSDDYFMGNLSKLERKLESPWKRLPTISRSCMKKAGVTLTPRRMPSSTSS
jgi:hypothetical protein